MCIGGKDGGGGGGFFGMGMQAVGTIMQMRAAKAQAEAQAQAQEWQARQLDRNAGIADAQANDAMDRGALEESRVRKYGKQTLASQRSANASSGFTSSGSILDILAGTHEDMELDAATVRANAQRERWAYGTQAEDLRDQAALARAGANNSRAAGSWNAMTTLIGGATSIADRWQKMADVGVPMSQKKTTATTKTSSKRTYSLADYYGT